MGRLHSSVLSRRLLVAWICFGIFVVADIALFGWLIFRSLSQREIDRVLLETQAEARELARRIADHPEGSEDDLYLVMAYQREIQRYIESELINREVVQSVEVYNQDGSLVYRKTSAPAAPLGEEPVEGLGELPPPPLVNPSGEPGDNVIEPIGDLGWLHIGISPAEIQERTEVLRRDLIGQMVWILMVSVAVLLSAYAIIWLLLVRARRLEEQAAEADRLAYIGTLAAGLAHEIRNPLNSLNLNMQMLEEELGTRGDGSTGNRLLGITSREIRRLERLVTDFLSYARPRPLELKEVSPGELLDHAREVLAGEFRVRGARVTVDDQCGGALIKVDPAQLNQLFLNLVQNALNATEEGDRRPEVRLEARLQGNRVVLTVEDNGTGIAPEAKERVFDIFYSTRKGGTGLGLAVVRRIARDHGGEVEVESTVGEGTRVSLSLPVAGRREEPVLRAAPRPA